MAITAANIEFYLSGGAGNSDPNASLGGARSGTQIGSALQNLFDNVLGGEAAAGATEYRCLYVKNAHASLTWEAVKAWIDQLTVSAGTEIAIGLDPAGVGGVAATIANDTTAPAGVAFSSPTTKASGLSVGNVGVGAAFPLWVRRVVSSGVAVLDDDNGSVRAEGDTAA